MAIYRLTLTLGMSSSAHDIAEYAARLAAGMGAALDALFVEERKLMRLAQSQLLRRVRMPGDTLEDLDAIEFETELRRHEAALRREIDEAARREGIEWSFRTVLDEPPDAAVAIHSDVTIVAGDGLFAHRREFMARLFADTTRLLVIPRRLARIAHPALVLASAPAHQGLALLAEARDFARRFAGDAPLTLLLLGEAAAMRSSDLAAITAHSALTLRRLPGTRDLATLFAQPPAGIDALVVPFDDPLETLGAILAHTTLPTLLLRRTVSTDAKPD